MVELVNTHKYFWYMHAFTWMCEHVYLYVHQCTCGEQSSASDVFLHCSPTWFFERQSFTETGAHTCSLIARLVSQRASELSSQCHGYRHRTPCPALYMALEDPHSTLMQALYWLSHLLSQSGNFWGSGHNHTGVVMGMFLAGWPIATEKEAEMGAWTDGAPHISRSVSGQSSAPESYRVTVYRVWVSRARAMWSLGLGACVVSLALKLSDN